MAFGAELKMDSELVAAEGLCAVLDAAANGERRIGEMDLQDEGGTDEEFGGGLGGETFCGGLEEGPGFLEGLAIHFANGLDLAGDGVSPMLAAVMRLELGLDDAGERPLPFVLGRPIRGRGTGRGGSGNGISGSIHVGLIGRTKPRPKRDDGRIVADGADNLGEPKPGESVQTRSALVR